MEPIDHDEKGVVTTQLMNLCQLSEVRHDIGYLAHWKDCQHDDDDHDKLMKAELVTLGCRNGVGWAVDDVSGSILPADGIVKAREEEMHCCKKIGVYVKVPRALAREYKIIRSRWINVNK